MKQKIALLLCAFLLLQGALLPLWAQTLTVTGKVTSKNNNEALPGATVTIKGTNTATITDEAGNFSINVPQRGTMLVISYAGMESQEVSTTESGPLAISLAGITGSLNEVVVIGYGQQRKANVTGSISSVKADQLETVSNTRLDQALQGRTAGVVVRPTSGQPGAPLNIRIRGTSSNRKSDPLFIVDGIKTGGMESIDPADIASIDILKDAASAAIYGSEGANGVIIITTKTGRRNSSSITYSGQYGIQSLEDGFIEMMNAQQYQQYLEEGNVAGRPTAADVAGIGAGTNWMKESTETAPQQHHSLTFSGGTDRTTYLVTGNIFTQDGVIGGDKSRFNRYSVRFNGDYRVKSWLNIGNRFAYSNHRRSAISDNDEFGSILSSAVVMDPTTPVRYLPGTTLPVHVQNALAANKPLLRDENGNLYGISNFLKGEYVNPVARIQETNGENVQNKIIGNVFADIEAFPGFKFTSRIGIDAAFELQHGWTPTYWFSDESQNTVANGYDVSNNWYTWLWENFATYQKRYGDHNFSILGGTSAQKTHEQYMNGSYSGLFKEDDRFSYADFVPDDNDRIGSTAFDYTLSSFFGRLTYDYKGRFLFNASVRSDGTSKVAPENQWKTFPAFSAGWVLSNESFFPTSFSGVVSYAKLRASWGQNGSIASVGIGEWMNRISAGLLYPDANGNLNVGAAPTSIPNPDLTWETGEQYDFGADFSFFRNRLNFTVDYYKRTTKDLLTAGTAPLFVGNSITTVNAGDVVNKGWEFELSYANAPVNKGAFTYEISGNLSTLDNEVTYLDPTSPIIFGAGVGTGWSATAMQVGYPIWYFNGYKTSGIFQTQDEINSYLSKTGITGYNPKPGEPIVVDVNGDKLISGADQTMIGSPHPTLSYGGRLTLGFKGFDFLMFVQGQSGNDILMAFNRTDRATANKPLFFYNDRWTGPGSTNSWFAPNGSNPYIYNSDMMIFKGAYTRIRQLQLGYTLPTSLLSRAKINNARMYVSFDDYFTFTDYQGVDPEGGSNDENSIGIDRGGYPLPRKVMFGLTFSF
jgi:TonB-dependent starch-binding outer membrane protein SusC